VLDNVERINSALHYREAPALFRNAAGHFERVDLGQQPEIAGRGLAVGDINNDGTLDAIVAVLGGRPLVLRRARSSNHWLTLKLIGSRSNRDGIGARVSAGKQLAYCTTSGSYLSASDGRVHFGLGKETHTKVEIQWPSGTRQQLPDVAADTIITVKEPE
jgi:hypothetical protein